MLVNSIIFVFLIIELAGQHILYVYTGLSFFGEINMWLASLFLIHYNIMEYLRQNSR